MKIPTYQKNTTQERLTEDAGQREAVPAGTDQVPAQNGTQERSAPKERGNGDLI